MCCSLSTVHYLNTVVWSHDEVLQSNENKGKTSVEVVCTKLMSAPSDAREPSPIL